MKRISGLFIILLSVMMMFSACKSKQDNSQSMQALNSHQVKVQEFIHTTDYTYFKVTEGNVEYWMAAPKREAKKGETLYYTTSYPMADFKSTELDRVFDMVYFIQDLTNSPQGQVGTAGDNQEVHMGTPRNQNTQVSSPINTQKAGEITGVVEEEVSLHELLTNPNNYVNKLVTVSGKVTKVNPAIMARNWVHITTEPADDHNHDLTITTQQTVELDQVLTFQGQISINRDFGAGYKYGIIMENAKLINK